MIVITQSPLARWLCSELCSAVLLRSS